MNNMISQQKPLGKRELSLLILIGFALLFPIVGYDIRHYIDSKEYIYLGITLLLVGVFFYIIRRCINIVIPRYNKHLYIDKSI